MPSALPRLAALEHEHGSVLRGAIAERGQGGGVGPKPRSRSPTGLEELPRALAAAAGRRAASSRAPPAHRARRRRLARAARGGRRPSTPSAVVVATPGGVTARAARAAGARRRGRAAPPCPTRAVAVAWFAWASARRADLGMDLDALRLRRRARRGAPRPARLPVRIVDLRRPRAARAACCCARSWAARSSPRSSTRPTTRSRARAVADLRRVAGLRAEPDFVAVWRHRARSPSTTWGFSPLASGCGCPAAPPRLSAPSPRSVPPAGLCRRGRICPCTGC